MTRHYDYDDDEFESDWMPGECDQCAMKNAPPELRAPFMPVCACSIGEGASPNECACT